jgi:hypothetical protein
MVRLKRTSVATIAIGSLLVSMVTLLPDRPAKSAPRRASVVLMWNEALLQGVRESTIGPPMVARALAIAHTCMFDAWAGYDRKAVGTQLGDSFRRPARDRTIDNKEKAVSFAAYRAAVDLFPHSKATVFDPLMVSLGYDPSNTTTDTTVPAGIGNVACQAVLDYRHHDGSNQLGDEPGGQAGVPYSDYTSYIPKNDPMDLAAEFDQTTVKDVNYWQPLTYINAAGQTTTPKFLGHHWNQVTPFALRSASQFRHPTGPAMMGSARFEKQSADVLALSAALNDRRKMISEYWADGPNTETPPGHWNLLAQFVSRRDKHGLDDDVKMLFALNNALFDAGISTWDNKIAYDSVRPITAVRHLYRGEKVLAWSGPGRGTQVIDGEDWVPYQRTTFPTPPFAEYTSGHSTFSAAAAEILKRFTGSDRFGACVTLRAGSSYIEPGLSPATDVTLSWDTFSEAADQAGLSRRYGGIHFRQGDRDGRAAGRIVAAQVWKKVQTYFKGAASLTSADPPGVLLPFS